MRFTIEAELLQGEPRLRIFDADSGALRLHWRYRPTLVRADAEQTVCCDDHACAARANLHALMRELFLLSCTGTAAALARYVASDHCMHCDACVQPAADAPLAARLSRLKRGILGA